MERDVSIVHVKFNPKVDITQKNSFHPSYFYSSHTWDSRDNAVSFSGRKKNS